MLQNTDRVLSNLLHNSVQCILTGGLTCRCNTCDQSMQGAECKYLACGRHILWHHQLPQCAGSMQCTAKHAHSDTHPPPVWWLTTASPCITIPTICWKWDSPGHTHWVPAAKGSRILGRRGGNIVGRDSEANGVWTGGTEQAPLPLWRGLATRVLLSGRCCFCLEKMLKLCSFHSHVC